MSKKIISVFLSVVILLFSVSSPCPVYAEGITDTWLSDWEYEIKDLSYDGPYIWLNQYTGSNPDVTVYGKAYVDGTQYPVCINVTYVNDYSPYITGINCSQNIVNLTFESVDGTKVRSSRSDRLDDFFRGMVNLETVHFGGNFRGDVAQASNMFSDCTNLRSVDIETLDFGYSSIYHSMFRNCSSLKEVTINCPRGYNMITMFAGCTSLTDVTMTGCDGHKLNVYEMFQNCTSLKNVDLSGLDLSKTEDFEKMFENCSALETINMGDIDMSSAKYTEGMFTGCTSLTSIDLSATNWSGDTISAKEMFYNCKKLEEITLSEDFRPTNCTNMIYVPQTTILKVKGNVSDEFRENVLSTFKASNRYIGFVKLISLIELEGRNLEDCMFSVEMESDSGSRIGAFNYADYGNKPELSAVVYLPGSNTFTIEERYVSKKQDGIPVETIPISESDYSCEDAVRSKTVNIVLNTDGSLTVGE